MHNPGFVNSEKSICVHMFVCSGGTENTIDTKFTSKARVRKGDSWLFFEYIFLLFAVK